MPALATFVTLPLSSWSSAARYSVGCGLKYTMTKVGKSDCEGTFAWASGNDEDAPIPASRMTRISRLKSTLSGHSLQATATGSNGRTRSGSFGLAMARRNFGLDALPFPLIQIPANHQCSEHQP